MDDRLKFVYQEGIAYGFQTIQRNLTTECVHPTTAGRRPDAIGSAAATSSDVYADTDTEQHFNAG